ncbi:alpha/beta hydrolase [Streptomyces bobili]|uniref:alpha/beta hydrolase n=1 Tax=Streptomyces bobili TaxID=67280 RepID=UPI00364CF062
MSEFSTFEYASGGDPRQRLDVFVPEPAGDLRTAVLVLHGGAFRHGDRTDVHARCRALSARGFTAIAVGYRLLDSAAWPAQLDDARTALRWTHEHADELGVDIGRIAVQGHSAGAQLALLVAGTTSNGEDEVGGDATHFPAPAAVVAYYPPSEMSLTPGPEALPAKHLLGPDTTAEVAAQASPINHIDEHFPPTVLVHGAVDRFMPRVHSLRLYDALASAQVVGELHLIAGQDHEFDMTPRYADGSTQLVVDFLRAQVVEPDRVTKEVAEANPFVSMPPPGAGPAAG